MQARGAWKLLVLLAAACLPLIPQRSQAAKRLNVLMIAVDDLKPALGCYGDPLAISPNIDRLAGRGVLFNRAYCMQAVCSPSRNALLTSRRPDTIRIYDLATHFRTTLPDVVTLPQQFKLNGYHSEGMGKIYHVGHGNYDDVHSWSIPSWPPNARGPIPGQKKAECAPQDPWETDAAQDQARPRANPNRAQRGPAVGAPDVADNALFDGKLADHAIERLKALKDRQEPFFMAVGFHKPHLPFVAPKRYWDLHDPKKFQLSEVRSLPEGAPGFTGNGSGELRQYQDIPQQGPMPDELARNLVHGYYAAVSYMDAQLGRVLAELDRLGLRESTIVALWGDHGWHLGDHGIWCKHTNFEQAARSPLIISAPGMNTAGRKTGALAEFVDVYPTLCELAGVPLPPGLEGTSAVPVLKDPETKWKSAAFHQYPRNIRGQGQGMGHSVRTERYRLTEWTVAGKDFSALELYDYQADPEERVNLAGKPEHAKTVEDLRGRLHAGWKAALPVPAR